MHTITDRAARAMERLSQLAEIGADGERGGTTRPGLSVDEQRACDRDLAHHDDRARAAAPSADGASGILDQAVHQPEPAQMKSRQ